MIRCPYKKEEIWIQTHRKESCHVVTEAMIGVMSTSQRIPKIAGNHKKLSKDKDRSFLELSERAQSFPHLG